MKTEFMKTPNIEGEYRSPKAKVIEVSVEGLICDSNPPSGGVEDGGETGVDL